MANEYFSRTPSVTGNRKTWTWSGWIKRTNLSESNYQRLFSVGPSAGSQTEITIMNTDQLRYEDRVSGTLQSGLDTTRKLRDLSAWYHIVIAIDISNATQSLRQRMYINGELQTDFAGELQYSNTSVNTYVNTTAEHRIGESMTYAPNKFLGYMSDVYFVDGQSLAASVFGKTSSDGKWVAKTPAEIRATVGSFGTNGFYLPFDNKTSTSTLGYDYQTSNRSGTTNDWTQNNFSTSDAVGDGVDVNFMTMIPTATDAKNSLLTVTKGGTYIHLEADNTTDSIIASSTVIPKTGKWYAELKFHNQNPFYGGFGIVNFDKGSKLFYSGYGNSWLGNSDLSGHTIYAWVADSQRQYQGIYNVAYPGSKSYDGSAANWIGAIFQMAIDRDNGKMYWGVNGTWVYGNPTTGSGGFTITNNSDDYIFANDFWNSTGTGELEWNFGQGGFVTSNSNNGYADGNGFGKFEYTPPTGYVSLCSANYPSSTVTNPSTHFKALAWNGNATARTLPFEITPDLVFFKERGNLSSPGLVDSLRGASSILDTSSNQAAYSTNSSIVSGFSSSGLEVGDNSSTTFYINRSSQTYVGYAWNAGTTANLSGGDITPIAAKVNQTAGFSIVQYNTGSYNNTYTVPHGLTTAPEFMIIKGGYNDTNYNFDVYHKGLSDYTKRLILNSNTTETDGGQYAWNGQAPSNTLVTVNNNNGSYYGTNKNMIMYCWRSIPGYSKFGVYNYNNSLDGTFVYLGFKPALVIIKNTDNTEEWYLIDNARNTYNGSQTAFLRFSNTSESTANTGAANSQIDFLSTGFKLRDLSSVSNGEVTFGNRRYIYAAWAEVPFTLANAR